MEITTEVVARLLPHRPEDGHKGTFGHLWILAGSQGYAGAARLAAMGALRSGVGLVSVGVPESLVRILAGEPPEAMYHPLPAIPDGAFSSGALEPALEFAERVQAVAMGPGMSQHPETQEFIRRFVQRCTTPLVLDADGLNALAGQADALSRVNCDLIITPHPGELARLTGTSAADIQSDRIGIAERYAGDWEVTLVLKGHRTVVASSVDQAVLNTTGNDGMGTGGTGDVLSGLMGGLLAQGMKPFDAAQLAVYAHGRAGDLAAQAKTGRGMIASDLVGKIPEVWKELESF